MQTLQFHINSIGQSPILVIMLPSYFVVFQAGNANNAL